MAGKKIPTTRKKLTPRQIKFAEEYALTGNGTASALSAGYAYNTATVNLRRDVLEKPGVKEIIANRIAEREEKYGITADWLISEAREIVDDSKQWGVHGYPGRVAALDKIAKITGHYAELRMKHSGDQDNPIRVVLSEEQRKENMRNALGLPL